MIKLFLIFLVFLSVVGYSQVTILNNTNLNGFAMTNTTGTISKNNQNYGVNLTGIFLATCHLDTILNMACYDSLKIIYTAWRTFGTSSAAINGSNVSTFASTYTFTTLNISNLTLSVTAAFSIMNPYGYLFIANLKIMGYQSIISCSVAPIQPVAIFGPTLICTGTSGLYSITPVCGATNYSWALPGGWSGTSTTNVISATSGIASGNLSVTVSNSCGVAPIQILNVSIDPTPTVTINGSSSICIGSVLNLTANGANTYSWSNGASTSSIAVSPTINTTYSVTGTSLAGCTNAISQSVTVNPIPTIIVSQSNTIICVGETATISASGASTYSWSFGPTTNIIIVSPNSTSLYTLTGTSINGCTNTAIVALVVDVCTGISQLKIKSTEFEVVPNPFNENIVVVGAEQSEIKIYNCIGAIIYFSEMENQNLPAGASTKAGMEINLSNLISGLYFIQIKTENGLATKKIIKE